MLTRPVRLCYNLSRFVCRQRVLIINVAVTTTTFCQIIALKSTHAIPPFAEEYLQNETVHLIPPLRLTVHPNRNTPVSNGEKSPTIGTNHDLPGTPPKQIRPGLTGLVLANKHPFARMLPSVRHDNGQAMAPGMYRMPKARETDAVWLVKVIVLRAVCPQFASEHHLG